MQQKVGQDYSLNGHGNNDEPQAMDTQDDGDGILFGSSCSVSSDEAAQASTTPHEAMIEQPSTSRSQISIIERQLLRSLGSFGSWKSQAAPAGLSPGAFHSGYSIVSLRRTESVEVSEGAKTPVEDSLEDGRQDMYTPLINPLRVGEWTELPEVERPLQPKTTFKSYVNDLMYGLINGIVVIPTMISFTAIVFKEPVYTPYLGLLPRLAFLAGVIHQLIFLLASSMPFAVGQPQDVGLIFLSAMCTSVAGIVANAGGDAAQAVGTAIITMAIATLLVGVVTIAVGRFRLATLVQYVPLPVVGGYLSYVGYFCLAAGLALGTGVSLDTLTSWAGLIDLVVLPKLAATLGATALILVVMKVSGNPWALPVALAAVPVAFHLVLLALGASLADAQAAGWALRPPDDGGAPVHFWDLYRLMEVDDWALTWRCVTAQWARVLALFFVVTFGSSLDIAAIQADMPEPLDFNRELQVVGLSNMFAGLAGTGFTGSYIFSQTIFSKRAGVSTHCMGALVVVLEAAVFAAPVSVAQYIPSFFFGSLLTVFGYEILGDWLVHSYSRVTRREYFLLLVTFVLIMQFGLQAGIGAGVILATLYFAVSYAQVSMTAFAVLPSRSTAQRPAVERVVLAAFAQSSAVVALSGFIFFGSALDISAKVQQAAAALLAPPALEPLACTSRSGKSQSRTQGTSTSATGASGSGGSIRRRSLESVAATNAAARAAVAFGSSSSSSGAGARAAGTSATGGVTSAAEAAAAAARLAAAVASAPRFIIMDFRRVAGLDATAAATFATLARTLRRQGVELVVAHAIPGSGVRKLLAANGVVAAKGHGGDDDGGSGNPGAPLCRQFTRVEAAAKYTEERFLEHAARYGLLPRRDSDKPLTVLEFLTHALAGVKRLPGMSSLAELPHFAEAITAVGRVQEAGPGDALYDFGQSPDRLFLILGGEVLTRTVPPQPPAALAAAAMAAAAGAPPPTPPPGRWTPPSGPSEGPPLPPEHAATREWPFGPGCVVGYVDMMLGQPRVFAASTGPTGAVLLVLTRRALDDLASASLPALAVLQLVMLRSSCLTEVLALDVLERVSAG